MDDGADTGQVAGQERLTIQETARRLGGSEGAVRKRVARGTLAHEKASDGRVYVYLDAKGTRGVDAGQDEGVHPESSALISQLRDEIYYLRDENRRKDEIIMQQALTVRQLAGATQETPQETQESPESASEAPGSTPPPQEQEEPSSRERSWWRRLFG